MPDAQNGTVASTGIKVVDSASSALDVAWQLYGAGKFDVGESVLALEQTEGRGQMRRVWDSPPGNIYAAIRLPMENPFAGSAAAIVTALLCVLALRPLRCRLAIKWPNDIVLFHEGKIGKCGGILLEERNGVLVAGIGLNVSRAPSADILRDGAALSAACLGDVAGIVPAPEELWKDIVKYIHCAYKNAEFLRDWKNGAENYLLWKGRPVEVVDGPETSVGQLLGLDEDGMPLLKTPAGVVTAYGSGMRLAPRALKD